MITPKGFEERRQKAAEMYLAGKTVEEICEATGYSKNSIRAVIWKAGVTRNGKKEQKVIEQPTVRKKEAVAKPKTQPKVGELEVAGKKYLDVTDGFTSSYEYAAMGEGEKE